MDQSRTDLNHHTHESLTGLPTLAAHENLPSVQMLESPLSRMALNRLANIIIGASGRQAAIGYEKALELWKLWHHLVRPHVVLQKLSANAFQSSQEVKPPKSIHRNLRSLLLKGDRLWYG